MKPISKREKQTDGLHNIVTITIEKSYLFGLIKRQEQYTSDKVLIGKYREWYKEPNKTLVPDSLSFQLDKFNELFDKEAL